MSKPPYTPGNNDKNQYDTHNPVHSTNYDQSYYDANPYSQQNHDGQNHFDHNHQYHSDNRGSYTSPILNDQPASRTDKPKKQKKSKKGLLVVIIVLFVLGLGCAVFYFWKFMYGSTIKPVITNPTMDVGLVTGPTALEDPIYSKIWDGMKIAESKYGLTVGYVAAAKDTDKDIDAAIDKACKEYHMVICYGRDMADNLMVKSEVYPQIKFIFIDGTLLQEGETTPPPNVFEAGFRVEEASYLAGYLAIKESPKSCLGFIGGKDEAARRAYYGYYAGAYSVDLSCEIRWGLPGANYDSNRIEFLATNMYSEGVQNIFSAVDPLSGKIIAEAARRKNKKMIASDVTPPQSSDTGVLVTVVKNYDTVVVMLLSAYKQNTLMFGQKMAYGFKEKAIDFPKPPSQTDNTPDNRTSNNTDNNTKNNTENNANNNANNSKNNNKTNNTNNSPTNNTTNNNNNTKNTTNNSANINEGISSTLWKQVEDLKEKILDGTLRVPGTQEEFESKYF